MCPFLYFVKILKDHQVLYSPPKAQPQMRIKPITCKKLFLFKAQFIALGYSFCYSPLPRKAKAIQK